MAKMKAVDAAVYVLEKEGCLQAFGVPGAAINPFYSALKRHGGIKHVLARHVEGASHMAEGYTRAKAGNIGICIGTSGPAGTDMITGLYSAQADSIPILCITGQAPRARLYKEDFQAVDIESIAKPVTKWAVTVREPALVPRVFQQAFHLMRSGRPGPVLIDLPFDVQMAEIEFDPDTYEPLPVYRPSATRAQIDHLLARHDFGMVQDMPRQCEPACPMIGPVRRSERGVGLRQPPQTTVGRGLVQPDFGLANGSQVLVELLAIAGAELVGDATSTVGREIEDATTLGEPLAGRGFFLRVPLQEHS